MAEILPSLLEYEENLNEHIATIKEMAKLGIKYFHIDIMEKPFIEDRNAFSIDKIRFLYNNLKDDVNFDFHIMSENPDLMIKHLTEMIPSQMRNRHYITIHREAYRSGLSSYSSKEIDLLSVDDKKIADLNKSIGKRISEKLLEIKKSGFMSGIALEPTSSLENLTDEIIKNSDMILLMSVISGKGGQKYIDSVTEKISIARKIYKNHKIAVDGGINLKTIDYPLGAGADYIIVGSAITKNANPIDAAKEFMAVAK